MEGGEEGGQYVRVTLGLSLLPSLSTSTQMGASEIQGTEVLCPL